MAITIHDRRTEALIREIGRETGEDPGAVVARAVETLQRPGGEQGGDAADDFNARFARLMALAPPRDPHLSWTEIEAEMDALS